MRVLVVDTALGLCSAGVFAVDSGVGGGAARPLGLRSEVMAKGHQERLAGMVRDAVGDAGGFEGVERIGVTVGPGSFTGLRVGLAFAQGLGAALGVPVVGISTLDGLAASVAGEGSTAALIDARRGQVYARFWRDGAAQGPAEALSIEAARERARALGPDVRLVGSGAGLIADDPATAGSPGPVPEALARLTAAADPATNPPRPVYLRAPDATPPSRLPGQPRPAPGA
ncbi:tRNA (adenosine(37)-N6)-threonylcarbamoyltransferase complex dimerization subunit type 1 TsaB [Roseibacterium beibuensis]|uniref:tRNA (adenosine(37)-N6)-threonylcarbamoyltransferase complex dimerization subunit type 1 TsaB n=1 Tax=[Roseibacterium] beibuensis TaxID=1193142 RepID=UPI00217D5F45|nr:tRNA (adenosine(37)-N6)-threonylcarbamoyltransferase complex dimerization subunit type 1 TsaB [Roseibacterium beibuensis]MCS6626339.1 tRNA (adenosine(37)-N6)-threonylcarbamoyltransferase complex dimerization subunit type 1 TsaB [Roseibacterium beibuensis]